jgi:hypothetical protein
MEVNSSEHPAAYASVKWVGRLVLAIMVVSVVYAGWLALANWDSIGI